MHKRKLYLSKIEPLIGKPVVKVITGMRRVGKSCLLRQIIEDLHGKGIPKRNVLYVDKESLDFDHIKTYKALNRLALRSLGAGQGPKFLFVDEVQEIAGWERAVASLAKREDIDIYVSGSNAQLFSAELATLLTGRYVEFPVYSLSFDEYLLFRGDKRTEIRRDFLEYLRFGGMPAIHHFELKEEIVHHYLGSVYNAILLKDVVKRHNIRNVQLLENIARYLFDNVGNVMSAKRIADYLKSQRLRVGVETVQNYLGYFLQALVAHKAPRYDVKGKRLLEIHEKYYLGDMGMRHALIGYREGDISGVLENVVFLELKRRGYEPWVGKLGDREIDFVATRGNERRYVQVCYLLASKETVAREMDVLRAVPDDYPKVVLSMDTALGEDFQGIRRLSIVDFLLGRKGLGGADE